MPTLTSTNPYTGEINATVETLTDEQLAQKIDNAHSAYLTRKNTPLATKQALFLRLADLLDARNADCALLETREMGSLWSFSKNVLKGTANLIRRNVHNVEQVLGTQPFSTDGLTGHIQYDPLGVIFGIAPRNFPFNQLLRAAVPNILAGNTVIYKHASNVPLCLQAIQQLFTDAGFPEGVFTALYITAGQSEQIIAHPAVQGVNLTGSEAAGATIGALAGNYLKRSVLELGGNDAFMVLDHADSDAVVALATSCRLSNAGQRCNSSKRFIVLAPYYETFVQKFSAMMSQQLVGDPLDPRTQLGPLSSSKLLHELHDQVTRTIAQGARLITGGTILDEARNLYAPTVLADVLPGMVSRQEELFGPVASVIKAATVEDAIALANDNQFGLSAVVYSDDLEQGKRVAAQLDGGMIFLNQAAGSKAALPFGGVKKSGYGKENGPDGLLAFTNKKVVLY